MRHRIAHRKLGRTSSHRIALRRNLAQSLFEHGQVTTTLAKAKDLRPFAEKLITLAKQAVDGSVSARRRLTRILGDRAVIPKDHRQDYDLMSDAKRSKVLRSRSGRRYRTGEPKAGMTFTSESIVHRLVNHVAPSFMDRPGGYTRVIKLGKTRIGDAAPTATLQLVGQEESSGSVTKPERSARRRRTERRYAALARSLKKGGAKSVEPVTDEPSPDSPVQPQDVEEVSDKASTETADDSGDNKKD